MYTVIPFILEMHFAQKISKLPSMPQLDQHIFRAYDIRGVADSQITEEACLWIGKAFGSTVRDLYGIDSPTIAVGRDARTHGPKFEQAVIDGLVSAGCSVLKAIILKKTTVLSYKYAMPRPTVETIYRSCTKK